MEKSRYFAIPINKKRFHVSEINNPVEVCELRNFSYLIKSEDGEKYISSNQWAFNYSVYDEDVEVEIEGVNISNEVWRKYFYDAGIVTIKNPKTIFIDQKTGIHHILTKENKLYRMRPLYSQVSRHIKGKRG